MNEHSGYDDNDLADLRRRGERAALQEALAMLASETTPATARASVIRAILGDAAQRRHDDQLGDLRPGEMTAAQLSAAIRQNTLKLEAMKAEKRADDAEEVEFDVLPSPTRSVFD